MLTNLQYLSMNDVNQKIIILKLSTHSYSLSELWSQKIMMNDLVLLIIMKEQTLMYCLYTPISIYNNTTGITGTIYLLFIHL